MVILYYIGLILSIALIVVAISYGCIAMYWISMILILAFYFLIIYTD